MEERSLNPYSNGMKIEHKKTKIWKRKNLS